MIRSRPSDMPYKNAPTKKKRIINKSQVGFWKSIPESTSVALPRAFSSCTPKPPASPPEAVRVGSTSCSTSSELLGSGASVLVKITGSMSMTIVISQRLTSLWLAWLGCHTADKHLQQCSNLNTKQFRDHQIPQSFFSAFVKVSSVLQAPQ